MKPTPVLHVPLLLVVLSAPSWGQAPQPSSDDKFFQLGEVHLGAATVNVDTISSKFTEYRDVPNGVTAPFFRILGAKESFRYELVGENVQQTDQHYRFNLETSKIRIEGDYNQIPHRFGANGVSLLRTTTSRGTLGMSDTLQQEFQSALEAQRAINPAGVNFAFLNALVSPSLAAGSNEDLMLRRERSNFDVSLTPEKPYDVHLTYFREKRSGDRAAAGTSFGFGNVVETPEPVGYLTQDLGASIEYGKSWGLVRGAFHYNWFDNSIGTLAWDNPFRATDSTDPSAYTAPGAGSINGPVFGLMALPPSNNALNGSFGTTLRFKRNTRVTADFTFGSWTQNESPFIAYTTNTAITSPLQASNVATLPARQLDGDILTTSQVLSLTTRPADRFTLRARFRRYDLDNRTPRITLPGYVRFDGVWEDIGRISVPYGYTNDRFDATASYDLGPVSVEGGFRFTGFDRTFRETERTTENAVNLAVDFRRGFVLVRGSYERASRSVGGTYDFEHSEEASFTAPGAPSQLPQLRRFDQAPRDADRFSGTLQLTPGGSVMFALNYVYNRDDYHETTHGLIESKWDSFSADIDYTPSDRWNVFGFYSRENVSSFQRGRQSAATPSTDPLANWTADLTDDVDSFGVGGTFGLVPEKVQLRLRGRYQKADGNADLDSPPGGTPDLANDVAQLDDTKLWTALAEVEYFFAPRWSFTVGGWLEDYEIRDAFSTFSVNYFPGSFFLAANDGDYKAKVGYVRLSFRF